jgi:hypothetical protein
MSLQTWMSQQLVVRTDRVAARRRFQRWAALVVVSDAFMAATLGGVLGLLAGAGDGLRGWLVGALIAVLAFANGVLVIGTGGLDRLRVGMLTHRFMAVDAAGLWLATPYSAAGELFLPWDTLAPLSVGNGFQGPRLIVRLRPGVRADHPGADGLQDARLWRMLTGPGVRVGLAGTTPEPDVVLAAIERYSGRSLRR